MIDVLFAKQDSLGLKSWQSFAREAEVVDSAGFVACVESTDALPFVESGIAAGKRIGLVGTPTVIVNGWRFCVPPDDKELKAIVDKLLRGEKPN